MMRVGQESDSYDSYCENCMKEWNTGEEQLVTLNTVMGIIMWGSDCVTEYYDGTVMTVIVITI